MAESCVSQIQLKTWVSQRRHLTSCSRVSTKIGSVQSKGVPRTQEVKGGREGIEGLDNTLGGSRGCWEYTTMESNRRLVEMGTGLT